MAGIYIHIPFCKQACLYCDFHFSTSLKHKTKVLDAIKMELKIRKNQLAAQTIETIYFGGGTPSILSFNELSDIFNTIYENYSVAKDAEITLEANPDDLSIEKLKQYHQLPINRLSIGIQSFFDEDLKFMNRAHSAKQAKESLALAQQYFKNITIDLIYGLPDLNVKKWKENLKTAFEFNIPHISSYALTVEPNTALGHLVKTGKIAELNNEKVLNQFNILVQETKNEGFVQYEISNFGKPSYFSKHNSSYWKGKWYLGIGPAAHSYFGAERSWNISNNIKYVQSIQQGILPQTIEKLSIENQFNEYIMTRLRTIWGVSFNEVQNKFGIKYQTHLNKSVQKYLQQGLLIIEEKAPNKYLKITEKGKFLADGIAADLFQISS